MSEGKMDRAKVMEDHRIELLKTKKDLSESKSKIVEIVDKSKEQCGNIDAANENIDRKISLIDSVKPHVKSVNAGDWDQYLNQIQRDKNFGETAAVVTKDLPPIETQIDNAFLVLGSFESTTCSGTMTTAVTFSSVPDAQVKSKIKEILSNETISEMINFIRTKITSLFSGSLAEFNSFIKNWQSEKTESKKHQHLLSLRSVIYYQIFNNLCQQSNYVSSPWYAATSDKRGRYCQTKYFILGNNDLSRLSSSTIASVDSFCLKSQNNFNELSEIGKNGCTVSASKNTFINTITDFVEILKLRDSLFSI
jgi:hypothetical protein